MSRWLEIAVGWLFLVANGSAQDRICGGGDAAAPTAGLRRTVYYTGKFDTQMWNLTTPHWGAAWPAGWRFEFHDDAALEASILALDRRLAAAGVANVSAAFAALRPWAFRADLWRYCILWACGGVYLDCKMRLNGDVDGFVDGFEDRRARLTNRSDLLYVCRDLWATSEDRAETLVLWNGFMMATPSHPVLRETIRAVVDTVMARRYPEEGKLSSLYVTGPGALGRAAKAWSAGGDVAAPCGWRAPHIFHTVSERTTSPSQDPHARIENLFAQDGALRDRLHDRRHGESNYYGTFWKNRDIYNPGLR